MKRQQASNTLTTDSYRLSRLIPAKTQTASRRMPYLQLICAALDLNFIRVFAGSTERVVHIPHPCFGGRLTMQACAMQTSVGDAHDVIKLHVLEMGSFKEMNKVW